MKGNEKMKNEKKVSVTLGEYLGNNASKAMSLYINGNCVGQRFGSEFLEIIKKEELNKFVVDHVVSNDYECCVLYDDEGKWHWVVNVYLVAVHKHTILYNQTEIKHASFAELNNIIDSRKPLGCFYSYGDDYVVAVDNTTGDAWTEDFFSITEAWKYLAGEIEGH